MTSTGDIKFNTRGRPKKYKPNDIENNIVIENDIVIEKRGRGRPPKSSVYNRSLNVFNNSPSPTFTKLKNNYELGFINPLNGDIFCLDVSRVKYLLNKLKKAVFVFGRSCIYLNMIYEVIHYRPQGEGFMECREEFEKLASLSSNSVIS